jgi:hypothetical protein
MTPRKRSWAKKRQDIDCMNRKEVTLRGQIASHLTDRTRKLNGVDDVLALRVVPEIEEMI